MVGALYPAFHAASITPDVPQPPLRVPQRILLSQYHQNKVPPSTPANIAGDTSTPKQQQTNAPAPTRSSSVYFFFFSRGPGEAASILPYRATHLVVNLFSSLSRFVKVVGSSWDDFCKGEAWKPEVESINAMHDHGLW
jgi:hypothetical protein